MCEVPRFWRDRHAIVTGGIHASSVMNTIDAMEVAAFAFFLVYCVHRVTG